MTAIREMGNDELKSAVTTWMRQNLPADWVRAIDGGDREGVAAARKRLDLADWWRRMGDAGWFYSTWPEQYGGLEFNSDQARIVNDVLRNYKAPMSGNPLGQNAAAAILRWGTDQQRQRFLPPISKEKEYWVQLFSEPGAGSDLAGLSTRAVRDGDQWIVNGQKVWSSYGQIADYGLLIARTDPDVPKHQGLSVFLLNIRQPGVTVRPLHHITGEAHFNEVFFDNAVVGDDMRLGELGQGWSMVSSLLSFERGGGGGGATSGDVGRSVVGLLKHYGHVADPEMRQRLAEAYCRERIGGWIRMRIDATRKAGLPPGHERSIQKLYHSEHMQALQNLSVDLEGLKALAREPGDKWAESAVYAFLFSRSLTIAGGTSEIQRNIIGEKVLGLPREAAIDRDIPWRDIRRS